MCIYEFDSRQVLFASMVKWISRKSTELLLEVRILLGALFNEVIMIDNFNLIASILREKSFTEDEFIFLQLIKRKKDNPDMNRHAEIVRNFHIKNAVDLFERKQHIVNLCETNNARAYIRLNKRSKKKVALQTLALIAQNIASENYDIKNCYESCAGQFHSDEHKTWVIDIDRDEVVLSAEEKQFISELVTAAREKPLMYEVPTKNGYHIICTPFNMKTYQDKFGYITYHKDNPTILYIP